VADARVAADLHLAADVCGDLAAKVTFNSVIGLDELAQLHDLIVGQVSGALVRVDARCGQGGDRTGAADPEDVRERDLRPLVAGEVDAD
jgi:hypothetical protein